MRYKTLTVTLGVAALCLLSYVVVDAEDPQPITSTVASAEAKYTEDGELVLPADWRTWVFAGTSITPNDMNDGKALFPEFHHIYASPATYEAVKKTGEFPEGAMVAKELSTVAGKEASSGHGYFEGDLFALAIMVKDSRKYPDTEGWGFYSYFRDKENGYAKTAKLDSAESCYECHAGGAETELVFTQYYPVLREAMAEGIRKAP